VGARVEEDCVGPVEGDSVEVAVKVVGKKVVMVDKTAEVGRRRVDDSLLGSSDGGCNRGENDGAALGDDIGDGVGDAATRRFGLDDGGSDGDVIGVRVGGELCVGLVAMADSVDGADVGTGKMGTSRYGKYTASRSKLL